MEQSKSLVVSARVPKGDKYLPLEWVQKLYDAIDNPRDRAYLMYHLETGLRVSEVVGTHLENVKLREGRTWTFDFKKDQWRWVYWPPKVKGALLMWLKIRGNSKGRLFPFTQKTANRILKRWCIKIGFVHAEKVSSHWLRHTFIRLSRKMGRDIKAVQQNTGDSVTTILEWYSELSSDDMKDQIGEGLK